jgi:hypothetical protein
MKSTSIAGRRLPRIALIQALVLGLAPAASAQNAAPPPPPGEGVKVHGHWAIDVLTPQGDRVSHTEFDNDLDTTTPVGGADILAKMLTRVVVGGPWALRITGINQPLCPGGTVSAPGYSTATGPDCWSIEAASPLAFTGTAAFKNLTMRLGQTLGEVIFSGNVTVFGSIGGNATIDEVATHFYVCSSSATNCLGVGNPAQAANSFPFTRARLGTAGRPAPIPVQPGQIVQVTVSLRFS